MNFNGLAHFTIYGNPRTKKNSQRIVSRGKYHSILPSKAYMEYSKHLILIFREGTARRHTEPLQEPITLMCHYYMKTRGRVDKINLEEATHDILVDNGVLKDDDATIIASTDGTRVFYSKENPRVEIYISKFEEKNSYIEARKELKRGK